MVSSVTQWLDVVKDLLKILHVSDRTKYILFFKSKLQEG